MIERIPPAALESEQAIIGCCLIEPKICIPEAVMVITSSAFFYCPQCQIVWELLCDMPAGEVNLVTVMQRLKDGAPERRNIGIEFLNTCQDAATSTANLPVWIEEIQDKKILRDILAVCQKTTDAVYRRGNMREILDRYEMDVLAIRPMKRDSKSIKQLLTEAVDIIEAKTMSRGSITGLPTGLSVLDELTDGVHRGELVVIAGYPSTGKTVMGVNIAVHNALAAHPVGIISAEMRPVQLVVRSMCSEAAVNFRNVCEEDVPRLMLAGNQLVRAKLFVEQGNGFSITQVRATARRLKQAHDIRLIVVDYIQLLSGDGETREQEVASISRGLKAMALELEITVLALSQLNESGKMRESRAIGQDADSVWVLENDGEWQPKIQPIKLRVDKSRDGETGYVNLILRKEITRFEQASKVHDEDVPNNPHND